MKQTLKKLRQLAKLIWRYEIPLSDRVCGDLITSGDVCKALAGIPAVIGLVGAFVFLWIIVYTPHY